jgi:phospholipid transport system substrate-binding protein
MKTPMNQNLNAISVAMFLVFLSLLPSNLMAGTPTDQIRATVDEVVAILKDPQLQTEERHEERRKRLKQAIHRRFDFTEMARRSLGSEWRRLTPAERDQFTLLFTNLLERTYIDTLQSLDDEEIDFQEERREGDYAEVKSRILSTNGRDISINYRSFLVDGEWKIHDIVAENISLVNNYRSQFKRILAKSSYDELVRRIRKKL